MQYDASYNGRDSRKTARARWCSAIVALVEDIRSAGASRARGDLNPNLIGSPKLLHFGVGVLPYQLPSLGTKPGSERMTRLLDGFPSTDPTCLADDLLLPTNPQLDTLHGTSVLKNGHTNIFPQLYLGGGDEVSAAAKWPEDFDFAMIMQSHMPNQKDNDWKEEVAKMKATLADKRMLNREGSNGSEHDDRNPFPLKLYDMVTEQNNEIIGWLPEGKAFKVRDMENFENIILPTYFKRMFSLLTSTSLLYVSHE
jgi:hypothetical protein